MNTNITRDYCYEHMNNKTKKKKKNEEEEEEEKQNFTKHDY